jgi:hypothetical protein
MNIEREIKAGMDDASLFDIIYIKLLEPIELEIESDDFIIFFLLGYIIMLMWMFWRLGAKMVEGIDNVDI